MKKFKKLQQNNTANTWKTIKKMIHSNEKYTTKTNLLV